MKWVQQPHLGNQRLSQLFLFPSAETLRSECNAVFTPTVFLISFWFELVKFSNVSSVEPYININEEVLMFESTHPFAVFRKGHCLVLACPSLIVISDRLSGCCHQLGLFFSFFILCCVIKRHKQSLSCDSDAGQTDILPAVTVVWGKHILHNMLFWISPSAESFFSSRVAS